MHINVPAVDVEKLMQHADKNLKTESSKVVRERVLMARKVQNRRFSDAKIRQVFVNANMKNKHIKVFCQMDTQANLLLKQAVNTYNLSARTYFRLIKVARTIADLAGEKEIKTSHVAEALQYRIRVQE